jgi:hypothetical protein
MLRVYFVENDIAALVSPETGQRDSAWKEERRREFRTSCVPFHKGCKPSFRIFAMGSGSRLGTYEHAPCHHNVQTTVLPIDVRMTVGLENGLVTPAETPATLLFGRRHISPPKTSVAKRAIPDVTASEKTSNPAFQAHACRAPIEHQSVFKVTSWYQKEATDQP